MEISLFLGTFKTSKGPCHVGICIYRSDAQKGGGLRKDLYVGDFLH